MKQKFKVIIIIAVIVLILFLIFLKVNNNLNSNIIATKKITEFGQSTIYKYTIKIKNHTVQSIEKVIKTKNEEEAQIIKRQYGILNQYEKKGIEIKLKGKTLILDMPEQAFKDEIGYSETNNIKYILNNQEQKEIMNISKVKELLQEQGYTIK
ncbi:MAG: hypothetical protein J5507_02260 [Clostridia bacterium]|nr:hypothetical protein [Clostridia bacterium]